jgi:DNA-binding XRE family transcriptional regulator
MKVVSSRRRDTILLSQRTRKLRAVSGMSVKEMSRKSGISGRTINRIEEADVDGIYNPHLHTLTKLARTFNVTIQDLVGTK